MLREYMNRSFVCQPDLPEICVFPVKMRQSLKIIDGQIGITTIVQSATRCVKDVKISMKSVEEHGVS